MHHESMCGLDSSIAELINGHVIALTGAGGKTSLLVLLSRYYQKMGKRVLQSTTTKMQHPAVYDYGSKQVFLDDDSVFGYQPAEGESVFYARTFGEGMKVCSPPLSALELLAGRYDVMILEADGARRLPLKLHTERDPVIPSCTTAVIAVMGLSALGKPVSESCFGEKGEGFADVGYLQHLFEAPEGTCKGCTPEKTCLVLCNQFEMLSQEERDKAVSLRCPYPLLYGSVRENRCYCKRV